MTDSEAQVPSSVRDEECVLGSILIDPDAIHEVNHILQPESFYLVKHGWIYEAILALSQSDRPIDPVTVSTELEKRDRLKEIGGESYIIDLISVVPTSVNVLAYAREVKAMRVRRELIEAARVTVNLARDLETPIAEVVGQSENAMFQVAARTESRNARTISAVAHEHMERMEYLNENEGSDTIPTGFTDLDFHLGGGFERGDFIVVPGDTSMGKSSLLLSMLTNMARKGFKVAHFSLEMPARQLFQRQVAAASRVSTKVLRQPHSMVPEQWAAYYDAVGRLSQLPYFMDDTAITPMSLLSKCRRLQPEGLDVVAVDYLALMGADDSFGTETLRLGSISRALKLIAMNLDVVLIAAAQFNSKAIAGRDDKRPRLADLRHSSDPALDGDKVLAPYRDEYYNPNSSDRPNIMEVIVLKNREGDTFAVDLYWHGRLTVVRNLQRQEVELNPATSVEKAAPKYDGYGKNDNYQQGDLIDNVE